MSEDEERFEIVGEMSPEEEKLFMNMIGIKNVIKPKKPKMSLEELIEAAREIDSEINMFEARWLDKVDTLTYKDAINLIFAEIDRYPTIKKYNANKQEKLQSDFVEEFGQFLGREIKTEWSFVKSRLITQLTPNRWV